MHSKLKYSEFNNVKLKKFQNFAQKVTNADRSSLFLVDHKRKELYAKIFDVGTQQDEQIKFNEYGNEEIR